MLHSAFFIKKQYKQIPFYTPGFVTPGLAPAPMGICSTPGRPSLFHRHHCSTTKAQREDKRPDALRKDAVYLVGHSCPSCWTAQSLASSRCFRPGISLRMAHSNSQVEPCNIQYHRWCGHAWISKNAHLSMDKPNSQVDPNSQVNCSQTRSRSPIDNQYGIL